MAFVYISIVINPPALSVNTADSIFFGFLYLISLSLLSALMNIKSGYVIITNFKQIFLYSQLVSVKVLLKLVISQNGLDFSK